MASLLTLCFWIMLLVPQIEKCSPYVDQLNGYKYAKSKYYQLQLEFYIKHHPNKPASEAYTSFDIPDGPWNSIKVFRDKYYRLRKELSVPNSTPVQYTPNAHSQRTEPSTAQYATVIGDIKSVLGRLQCRKDHNSMITKQTPLSSACKLDDNGNLENRYMLQFLSPKLDTEAIKKCVSIVNAFNNSNTSLLHDPNAANKGKTCKIFSERVDQSIDTFWEENTTPDPNTAKCKVIRDENGNKRKERYRYCHMKYSEMYRR